MKVRMPIAHRALGQGETTARMLCLRREALWTTWIWMKPHPSSDFTLKRAILLPDTSDGRRAPLQTISASMASQSMGYVAAMVHLEVLPLLVYPRFPKACPALTCRQSPWPPPLSVPLAVMATALPAAACLPVARLQPARPHTLRQLPSTPVQGHLCRLGRRSTQDLPPERAHGSWLSLRNLLALNCRDS